MASALTGLSSKQRGVEVQVEKAPTAVAAGGITLLESRQDPWAVASSDPWAASAKSLGASKRRVIEEKEENSLPGVLGEELKDLQELKENATNEADADTGPLCQSVAVSAWGNWNPEAVVEIPREASEDEDEEEGARFQAPWFDKAAIAKEEERAAEQRRKKKARKDFGRERKAKEAQDARDTKEALLVAQKRILELEEELKGKDEELQKLSLTPTETVATEETGRSATTPKASVMGKSYKLSYKSMEVEDVDLESGGSVASPPEDIGTVTINDLGLQNWPVVARIDKTLGGLVTKRADVRLCVFGLWAVCHLVYACHFLLSWA